MENLQQQYTIEDLERELQPDILPNGIEQA